MLDDQSQTEAEIGDTESADARSVASQSATKFETRPKFSVAKLKKPLLTAAILAVAGAGVHYGANWYSFGRFQVETDDAYVGVRSATLSPKVSGYLTEIAVSDNASVKSGDIIARIDAGDYQLAVRAAREQCDTQLTTIERFDKQITSQRTMVDQAKAQADSARAGLVRYELELKRQLELAARQINTQQALEQAQANRDQAVASVKAADAAVATAAATVGVYEAQRAEAQNTLKQYKTALDRAERDLSFTDIRAPYDGVLGNRAVQIGDYVQPTQRLASLVPVQSVYIDANFKETQLARLAPGQPVSITVDAQSGKSFMGRVVSLAPASGSVFSLLPPDNATGNFTKVVQRIPVRIAVPSEIAAQGVLRPGMSVVVSIDTRQQTTKAAANVTSDRIN
jgi:membrane fusion protein, multidrug efflux system